MCGGKAGRLPVATERLASDVYMGLGVVWSRAESEVVGEMGGRTGDIPPSIHPSICERMTHTSEWVRGGKEEEKDCLSRMRRPRHVRLGDEGKEEEGVEVKEEKV